MDEFNLIKEAIAGVGFPVFVAVYMMIYNNKALKGIQEILVRMDAKMDMYSKEGK
jgi:hypothetical protein